MKLEIGHQHRFEVRHETYSAAIEKSFTILYLSDLHFNKYSGHIVQKIIDTIEELNPDIILLGGDYADSRKGLHQLAFLMKAIAGRKNVLAVAGNHDYFFGLDEIKEVITSNNATWIEKASCTIVVNNNVVRIDGSLPSEEKSSNCFSILCLHQPINIKNLKNTYHLVLAGHLHGSQVVLWRWGNRLYPGRLFYRWNILKASFDNCLYLISKGLGDTLPIRYNCKKDLIFVRVIPDTKL